MKSNKLGLFVDYEEGLVSFHGVDTAELIYCFTGCCFDGQLRPYLKKLTDRNVGHSITQVKHSLSANYDVQKLLL